MPRWLHRLYATVARYFWLPCPVCGEWFGGHEAKATRWDRIGPLDTSGRLVCARHGDCCAADALRIVNQEEAA